MTEDTPPGSSGSVTRTVIHEYQQPGQYLVTLQLANSVSRANITKMVQVLNHLSLDKIVVRYQNEVDVPGRPTDFWKTDVPLTITAVEKTGISNNFTLSVNGDIITSKTSSFTYTFTAAGEYNMSVVSSGRAGISPAVTRVLQLARPLKEENLVLIVPNMVVWPPAEVMVTIVLKAPGELPTLVAGVLSWGDNQGETQLNFKKDTFAGAIKAITQNITHSYNQSGTFHVSLILHNPVSELNLTREISVVQQLELRELVITLKEGDRTLTRPQNAFFVEDTISITLGNIKGQADHYVLSVSGQKDLVQTSPTFILKFKRESDYEVAIVAEVLGETSNKVSSWVRIREKLNNLKVEVSDTDTRAGLEITFTIRAPLFLGACLSLNLGDGRLVGWKRADNCEGQGTGREEWQKVAFSELVTLTHKYSSPGVYKPTARLFSAMGELQEMVNIIVLDSLPCDYLNVWIQKNGTLEAPVSMTRADKLWVRSFADVNCSVPEMDMEISWKVVRVNDSEEVELSSVDTSKSVLYLPARTLHYGQYRAIVSYNISMINLEGAPVWTVLNGVSVIQVGKSTLMVVMMKGGAPRVRRGTLQTLSLSPGHVSYDPDYPEIPLRNFVWSCHLVGEELPARSVISDPPANRSAYTEEDRGGCWGQGPAGCPTSSPHLILMSVFSGILIRLTVFKLQLRVTMVGRILHLWKSRLWRATHQR
nr:uncharacterized protein LOC128696713 [Cherax quadricarinatus]